MSSKYNIECETWTKERKEFFVTHESKIWPCCHYTTAQLDKEQLSPGQPKLDDDEYIAELEKNDPDWNNSDVRSIDEIIRHDFFTKHISEENWASDTPPPMCVTCCHKEKK